MYSQGKNGGSAHLVVYKYGSIVLFNAPTLLEQHQELMQFCQRHTSEPILQPHHEGSFSHYIHQLAFKEYVTPWKA